MGLLSLQTIFRLSLGLVVWPFAILGQFLAVWPESLRPYMSGGFCFEDGAEGLGAFGLVPSGLVDGLHSEVCWDDGGQGRSSYVGHTLELLTRSFFSCFGCASVSHFRCELGLLGHAVVWVGQHQDGLG